MPTKTGGLDSGNFVHAPESPKSAAFSEYLDFADRLLHQWRAAREAADRLPLSPEVGQRKKELDALVGDLADSFRSHYGLKACRQDPAFLPVSRFFARYRPVRAPFSILHCNLEVPLHTVLAFRDQHDLARVNAALCEDAPLRWWQSGPHDRPCYLFGESLWELHESETGQSDEGLVVLFLQMSGAGQRHGNGRVGDGYAGSVAMREADFIEDDVRRVVWRRSRGRCAKCGAREGLEFNLARPLRPGHRAAPDDVELVCRGCLPEGSRQP